MDCEASLAASELFDVRSGLIWQLSGERVLAVETHGVRLRNGLTVKDQLVDAEGLLGQSRAPPLLRPPSDEHHHITIGCGAGT